MRHRARVACRDGVGANVVSKQHRHELAISDGHRDVHGQPDGQRDCNSDAHVLAIGDATALPAAPVSQLRRDRHGAQQVVPARRGVVHASVLQRRGSVRGIFLSSEFGWFIDESCSGKRWCSDGLRCW